MQDVCQLHKSDGHRTTSLPQFSKGGSTPVGSICRLSFLIIRVFFILKHRALEVLIVEIYHVSPDKVTLWTSSFSSTEIDVAWLSSAAEIHRYHVSYNSLMKSAKGLKFSWFSLRKPSSFYSGFERSTFS